LLVVKRLTGIGVLLHNNDARSDWDGYKVWSCHIIGLWMRE